MAELGVHQSALLTDLALCVNRYRLFSSGWYVCVLARIQLSPEESDVPRLVAMVNYGRRKRSHALPNLWLPLKAVQDRDWWAVLGCIERGVSRRANFA